MKPISGLWSPKFGPSTTRKPSHAVDQLPRSSGYMCLIPTTWRQVFHCHPSDYTFLLSHSLSLPTHPQQPSQWKHLAKCIISARHLRTTSPHEISRVRRALNFMPPFPLYQTRTTLENALNFPAFPDKLSRHELTNNQRISLACDFCTWKPNFYVHILAFRCKLPAFHSCTLSGFQKPQGFYKGLFEADKHSAETCFREISF